LKTASAFFFAKKSAQIDRRHPQMRTKLCGEKSAGEKSDSSQCPRDSRDGASVA